MSFFFSGVVVFFTSMLSPQLPLGRSLSLVFEHDGRWLVVGPFEAATRRGGVHQLARAADRSPLIPQRLERDVRSKPTARWL